MQERQKMLNLKNAILNGLFVATLITKNFGAEDHMGAARSRKRPAEEITQAIRPYPAKRRHIGQAPMMITFQLQDLRPLATTAAVVEAIILEAVPSGQISIDPIKFEEYNQRLHTASLIVGLYAIYQILCNEGKKITPETKENFGHLLFVLYQNAAAHLLRQSDLKPKHAMKTISEDRERFISGYIQQLLLDARKQETLGIKALMVAALLDNPSAIQEMSQLSYFLKEGEIRNVENAYYLAYRIREVLGELICTAKI